MPPSKRTVLFVCTGNTCRSPMAHYFLKGLLETPDQPDGDANVTVASAGTNVRGGEGPMAANALNALREFGVTESAQAAAGKHLSQQVSAEHLQEATDVLCFTAAHRDTLLSRFPEASPKVRLLMSLVGQPEQDIADPFQQSPERYLETLEGMRPCLEALIRDIRKA
eukprot:gnl/TRDRNA2_/TRDRNA2_206788_c0_seq1.p1 gnl/TRDRNA2_/TRDRNA2_206788_c0~~gnl/TRDRNA2_/TRDRNA2_206788_c0_seq1.p1  ORF type:complete len:167 (+),score=31.03 gnl/TRDRNA2_/TRDRNA2_206788_c0_seq1:56-556(+)